MTAPDFDLSLRDAVPSDVDDVTALENRAFPVPWKRA